MNDIKIKICKECGRELPATTEYFHKHNGCKDGLNKVCKRCRSKIAAVRNRKQMELNNGFKKCVDCNEILEINENNFKTKVNSLDGFYNVCIKCQIARRRNGADEGFKKCVKCNEIFPLDRDYFQPDKKCLDGFRNMCWKCICRDYFPQYASESWSDEDIEIVKNNYVQKNIKDIIPMLSVERTEKSIMHIAEKFGIKKISSYVDNYSDFKYKFIDNVLCKLCKCCKRYLPNNFDYYPKDENCSDGLRNVCRECKGELFKVNSNVHIWTDEEVEIMINYYSHFSNKELIKNYLPHLNAKQILRKAKLLKIYKTQETLNRIAKDNGNICSEYLLLIKKWQCEDNPQYNSKRIGELNPNYKGGISALYQELRRNIKQWKLDSMENCNYKCLLTNEKFDDIHHLYSFDSIVNDTLNETGLPLYDNISKYSEKQLKQLIDKCLEIHYRYPLGVCLNGNIHFIFHAEYGYGNNTEEQFYEFIDNYYNGKYKTLIV